MSMENEVFLLDANTLIEPSKKFYSFRIAPGFWTFLKGELTGGNLIILDVIAKEVSKGKDALASWLDGTDITPLDRRSPDIIAEYAKVLNYIHNSSAYNDRALALWSEGSQADPWIIATAVARRYTVITFEQPNSSLGTSQTSKPKIPDVCRALDVSYINLYQFMDSKGFSFPA